MWDWRLRESILGAICLQRMCTMGLEYKCVGHHPCKQIGCRGQSAYRACVQWACSTGALDTAPVSRLTIHEQVVEQSGKPQGCPKTLENSADRTRVPRRCTLNLLTAYVYNGCVPSSLRTFCNHPCSPPTPTTHRNLGQTCVVTRVEE